MKDIRSGHVRAEALSPLIVALAGLPEHLLVGISGGVDSVALLQALVKAGRKPVVLHFDHGWRAESADDVEWVRDLAEGMGLLYHSGKMRSGKGVTGEAEARHARYAFFARTAKRLGTADLVLAHHADDQVETFLLQLLRGTGSAGRGMEPVVHREGLILHRPWLGIWKKEIVAFAKREGLEWREDSTNADTRHRRNLIRRRILPYLQKQISASVGENLLRAAEIQRAEGEWLDQLCGGAGAQAQLSVKELRDAPLARQRRTILRWLQSRDVRNIGFADVEAVRGLLHHISPAKVNLSEGRFARRRAGKLFVE